MADGYPTLADTYRHSTGSTYPEYAGAALLLVVHPQDLDVDSLLTDAARDALTAAYVAGMQEILGDRWTVRAAHSNNEFSGTYINGAHQPSAPGLDVEVGAASDAFWEHQATLAAVAGGIDI